MVPNPVLAPPAQPAAETPSAPPAAAGEVDVVRDLLAVMRRNPVTPPPGARVRRPFDAQGWACWLVAVLLPVVLGILWTIS